MTRTSPLTRRQLREEAAAGERTLAPPPTRKSAVGIVGEVLLWVAALFGAVCIVLVILAYTMNITLVMFKTGSMSPTIPLGSVSVVQRVPASDIAVGDVVTVDREGQLPVTHRVTSISPGATAQTRTITMRGDANGSDDPLPYEVASVRRVLISIPGLAPFIVQLSNPFVLGGLTVGATLLVGWAFWPKPSKRRGSL